MIKWLYERVLKRLFPGDEIARDGILWNIAGLGISGASGIIMNVMIGFFYHPSVLGVFNRVMSFYIFLGQFGALGMQQATVYFLSRETCTPRQAGQCVTSFFSVTAITSISAALLMWLMAEAVGEGLYHSKPSVNGLRAAAPAVLFFAINKLLLGTMNGLRHMRAFAIFQSGRYLLIIGFIMAVIALDLPSGTIMWSFMAAEICLFFGAVGFLSTKIKFCKPCLANITAGIHFGARAVVGGIVGELNTKADIFVLGIFTSDTIVGIYSFASVLAEGFFTLIVTMRNNMNPLFSKLLYERERGRFEELNVQAGKKTLRLSAIGAIVIIVIYAGLCLVLQGEGYSAALLPLLIILACMTIAAPSIVRGNLLTLCGRPELDTGITFFTVLCNFGLNFLLIPHWGILGAAIATGCSYLLLIAAIRIVVLKYIERMLRWS